MEYHEFAQALAEILAVLGSVRRASSTLEEVFPDSQHLKQALAAIDSASGHLDSLPHEVRSFFQKG